MNSEQCSCGGHEAIHLEIDHLKHEVAEMKSDSKENNKYFREVIDTLKENSIRQTEILKNQEQQFAQVNNDIAGLREDMHSNMEMQTKWYQGFLSDNVGKLLKVLLIIVFALMGARTLGLDIASLLKIFN